MTLAWHNSIANEGMQLLIILTLLLCPMTAQAAEPAFEDTVMRAEVVSILLSGDRAIEGTTVSETYQRLSVRVIEGKQKGMVIEVENSTPIAFAPGDVFYLHTVEGEIGPMYAVGEPDRRWVLFGLGVLFVLVTIVGAGMAGVRSLLSLVVSFVILLFGLVPALSSGAPPVLTSIAFAVVMLAVAMLVTHGLKRATLVALAGSVAALVFAAVVAEIAVSLAKLSGFASDETVYLNFATDGMLNLPALLLGGILIGIVGILNDVSVSQVHTVIEISGANPSLTKGEVLTRAVRVGQEHLGAVVNTLPLAYAGASLPLILLFYGSDAPALFILNREMFAVELIRTFAGGIGLILSGVIATGLAVMFVVRERHQS